MRAKIKEGNYTLLYGERYKDKIVTIISDFGTEYLVKIGCCERRLIPKIHLEIINDE